MKCGIHLLSLRLVCTLPLSAPCWPDVPLLKMGLPLFDRIAVVDWSASASPKTGSDSIWIAVLDGGSCTLSNPPTRRAALGADGGAGGSRDDERSWASTSRLGFPAWNRRTCRPRRCPMGRAVVTPRRDSITDDEQNRNNRFDVARRLNDSMAARWQRPERPAGPFWGCPPSKADCIADHHKTEAVLRGGPLSGASSSSSCAARATDRFRVGSYSELAPSEVRALLALPPSSVCGKSLVDGSPCGRSTRVWTRHR